MGLSLGEYSRIGFGVIAVVMIVALFVYRRRLSDQSGLKSIALGLIAGGATGNLLDRVRSEQGVVDFIDVGVGSARFYTFNVADAAVFCGAVLLLLLLARQDQKTAIGH
jgi:signal peptidase II